MRRSSHIDKSFQTTEIRQETQTPDINQTMVSILSDEDEVMASLAMEKILSSENPEAFLQENGDATSPLLRKRLQQMSVILKRRALEDEFIRKYRLGTQTIWNAVTTIDVLYDTQSSFSYLAKMTEALYRALPQSVTSINEVTDFLKDEGFSLHQSPAMSPSYYLIGDTLEMKEGAPSAIAVIIHHLCELRNIPCTFCIYNGHLSLTNSLGQIIDAEAGFAVYTKVKRTAYNPCTISSFISIYLGQMCACALSDGDTWDCHFLMRLMYRIADQHPEKLPYPFGDGSPIIPLGDHTWKN